MTIHGADPWTPPLLTAGDAVLSQALLARGSIWQEREEAGARWPGVGPPTQDVSMGYITCQTKDHKASA